MKVKRERLYVLNLCNIRTHAESYFSHVPNTSDACCFSLRSVYHNDATTLEFVESQRLRANRNARVPKSWEECTSVVQEVSEEN